MDSMKTKQLSLTPATQCYSGLGVSVGIAIGPIHVVDSKMPHVVEYELREDQIDVEVMRFSVAVKKS